jgi:hypothetical protein
MFYSTKPAQHQERHDQSLYFSMECDFWLRIKQVIISYSSTTATVQEGLAEHYHRIRPLSQKDKPLEVDRID